MASKLFQTKSPDLLIRESETPERKMKRSLTALDLTLLGIGAIIGTGIFALTGTAAAGERLEAVSSIWKTPILNIVHSWINHSDLVLGRAGAGPAVVISFIVAAIACGFAALCYAELASMIPVSGSAYTYSYATLGELIAWIIGWDLILEYAVGNMAVAASWSGYFVKLCGSLFGLRFPLWAVTDHKTAADVIAKGGEALQDFSSTTLPVLFGHTIALNLPAFLIVVLVTILLVYGIRESARTNSVVVIAKIAVVVFFISFGAFFVNPTNWHPFMPSGFSGVMSGAAIVFFAFIGFDAVSTTAEETKNPQRDMPIGMIASLVICTLLYVAMSGVLTGMKKYTIYLGDSAAVATAFAGKPWAQALVSAGALAGMTSVLLVFQLGQPRIFMAMARDGLLPQYFCQDPSAFSDALRHHHLDRLDRRRRGDGHRHRFARRSNEYRNPFCVLSGLRRGPCSPSHGSHSPSALPRSVGSAGPDHRRPNVRGPDVQPPRRNLDPVYCLARDRTADLFLLRSAPQPASPRHRYGRNRKRIPADRAVGHRTVVAAVCDRRGRRSKRSTPPPRSR